MYDLLFDLVRYSALARSSWLLVGLVRMLPVHLHARTRRWGWIEVLALGELFGFLALTWLLFTSPPPTPAASPTAWLAAAGGALACVAGVLISVWAIQTTVRQGVILDGGHFVKREQPLITNGAYGFVRNPMYLGILLLWCGIAAAFQSLVLALVGLFYVLPVFLLYIRNEDEMMRREFGAPYEAYREQVASLLPRVHRAHG